MRTHRDDAHLDDHAPTPAPTAPGRRSLTQTMTAREDRAAPRLPSGARELELVQRKITRGADVDASTIAEQAERGVATPSSRLPHLDRVQASFGSFDVGSIEAHTGDTAARSATSMGARAYATGNHVVLGDGADLHTVAHEAAHVAQQRAGVARKSDAPGDEWERHADLVADRVVAGRSAEDLIGALSGLGASTSVQRKILSDGEPVSGKLGELGKADRKRADEELDLARAKIGKGVDEDRLLGRWAALAKGKKEYDLDTKGKVAAGLVQSYEKSAKSATGAKGRSKEGEKMVEGIHDLDGSLTYHNSARNPMLRPDDLAVFDWDKSTKKQEQTQMHLATVLNTEKKQRGEETQASLAKDKKSMFVSTNKNNVNNELSSELTDRMDIEKLAAKVAVEQGLESMDLETAMNDRVVRHAMKLFERLKLYLKDDGVILVPGAVDAKLDGRHAEIRIEQDKGWDEKTHHLPTGTMYPCMGCRLYFNEEGHDVGVRMGPMWVTTSALSTQMEPQIANDLKIGGLGAEVDNVAKLLSAQFKRLQKKSVEVGMGKAKDGEHTLRHQADSESELDESDFERLQKAMVKQGKPLATTSAPAKRKKGEEPPDDDEQELKSKKQKTKKKPAKSVETDDSEHENDD